MVNQNQPPALPKDKDLAVPTTEAEKLDRLQRESEINQVPPNTNANIGSTTTGVGQPEAQAVNQGQSLPAAAIPVKKKFEGGTNQFYDPAKTERDLAKRGINNTGGKKT